MLSGNAQIELERLYEEVRQETSIVQVYIKMARIKEINDASNAEDFSNDLRNFIGGGNDASQEGPLSSDLSFGDFLDGKEFEGESMSGCLDIQEPEVKPPVQSLNIPAHTGLNQTLVSDEPTKPHPVYVVKNGLVVGQVVPKVEAPRDKSTGTTKRNFTVIVPGQKTAPVTLCTRHLVPGSGRFNQVDVRMLPEHFLPLHHADAIIPSTDKQMAIHEIAIQSEADFGPTMKVMSDSQKAAFVQLTLKIRSCWAQKNGELDRPFEQMTNKQIEEITRLGELLVDHWARQAEQPEAYVPTQIVDRHLDRLISRGWRALHR